ncbi:MAG: hypothetical protein VX741_01595 [Pseudomonadota bacterium]|nr:hypothetical protein [Pseudomonadota bacterium]
MATPLGLSGRTLFGARLDRNPDGRDLHLIHAVEKLLAGGGFRRGIVIGWSHDRERMAQMFAARTPLSHPMLDLNAQFQ